MNGDGASVAVVCNIRIDTPEKLELLTVTIKEIASVIDEAHVKIRGELADKALARIGCAGFRRLTSYQRLEEHDWVAATRKMVQGINARSIFLYFEDHRLVSSLTTLTATLADFNALELDYMCYSFFRASRLNVRNVLPLFLEETPHLRVIQIDPGTMHLLSKISPTYFAYSLVSIASKDHLLSLLAAEDKPRKVFSRFLTSCVGRLVRYPGNRRIIYRANNLLARIGIRWCLYDPASPFNLEKIWWEIVPPSRGLRVGVPKQELFANFDDDNGADGESLVKRGLYPLTESVDVKQITGRGIKKELNLSAGQSFSLVYVSSQGRIHRAPILQLKIISGNVQLRRRSGIRDLPLGSELYVYANQEGELYTSEGVSVEVIIYDDFL